MDDLTMAEQDAPARLTPEQAEQLVLHTVSLHAEALLRTARRHSLCVDDAHDAYQRGLEILMRRAPTLDPEQAGGWMHSVVKHEALAVRKSRAELVHFDDVDFDRHEAIHLAGPEEQALSVDHVTRAAEALQRVKPQELRAMWLKAIGKSYEEICAETGWSYTKVNRCLAEGRKSFLERFAGIEAGDECDRWQPLLSAIADGEATAEQLTELRPHLRNCAACRATLRGLHESQRPLMAVLPVGLVGFGIKATSFVERILPGAPVAETAGAGGAGIFGIGTAKIASLLAAGAAATGGGIAVKEHRASQGAHEQSPRQERTVATSSSAASPGQVVTSGGRATVTLPTGWRTSARARRAESGAPKTARATRAREFMPSGPAVSGGAPSASAASSAGTSSAQSRPAAPTSPPKPVQPDSSTGEFAPHP